MKEHKHCKHCGKIMKIVMKSWCPLNPHLEYCLECGWYIFRNYPSLEDTYPGNKVSGFFDKEKK